MTQADMDELAQYRDQLFAEAENAINEPLNLDKIKTLGDWLEWRKMGYTASSPDVNLVRQSIRDWFSVAQPADRHAASHFSVAINNLHELWLMDKLIPAGRHLQ